MSRLSKDREAEIRRGIDAWETHSIVPGTVKVERELLAELDAVRAERDAYQKNWQNEINELDATRERLRVVEGAALVAWEQRGCKYRGGSRPPYPSTGGSFGLSPVPRRAGLSFG